MSANDDHLPWVPKVLDLIRRAQDRQIPMLGHCLGGQLISRALGGTVTRSPAEEIGWLPVDVVDRGGSAAWCGGLPESLTVYQWHNETFSIPPGAHKLFHRDTCPNQGFICGNTLALQFHLEVLPETVEQWATLYLDKYYRPCSTIQSRETMIEDLHHKTALSHRAADHVYAHWCSALM